MNASQKNSEEVGIDSQIRPQQEQVLLLISVPISTIETASRVFDIVVLAQQNPIASCQY